MVLNGCNQTCNRMFINGVAGQSGYEGLNEEATSSHVVRVGQLDQMQHDVRRRHQEPPLEGVHSREPSKIGCQGYAYKQGCCSEQVCGEFDYFT